MDRDFVLWGEIVTEQSTSRGLMVTRKWPDGTRVVVEYDHDGRLLHYEQDHFPAGSGGSGTLP